MLKQWWGDLEAGCEQKTWSILLRGYDILYT